MQADLDKCKALTAQLDRQDDILSKQIAEISARLAECILDALGAQWADQ